MTPVDLTREELIEALTWALVTGSNWLEMRRQAGSAAADDTFVSIVRIRAALAKLEEGE
jgi:hypothetical protein